MRLGVLFSGGKDSTLALQEAMKKAQSAQALLNQVQEESGAEMVYKWQADEVIKLCNAFIGQVEVDLKAWTKKAEEGMEEEVPPEETPAEQVAKTIQELVSQM